MKCVESLVETTRDDFYQIRGGCTEVCAKRFPQWKVFKINQL